ncbi:MAG TPA: hypothetical protein VLB85_14230 [Acidimicrobiia bacterium]|nr:hypothetical protein [Acidimicrobiia bacterium]
MELGFWEVLWMVCGVVTVIAAVLAHRGRNWRYLGRAVTGVLFLIGGALVHVINLATGVGYAGFADPAHFDWVTDAWRSVVAPNEVLFIGLLAAFEAAVGVLVLSGKRRTRVGYNAVIAFYVALWIFGWFETVWVAIMLPAMLLLLRAELRAETAPGSLAATEGKHLAGVGNR